MLSVVSARAKNEHLFTAAKVATGHGGLNIALCQSQPFLKRKKHAHQLHACIYFASGNFVFGGK